MKCEKMQNPIAAAGAVILIKWSQKSLFSKYLALDMRQQKKRENCKKGEF